MTGFPLSATCDGCGTQNGVLAFCDKRGAEWFCPDCMKRTALYFAALEQLELLVEQAVRAWVSTWEGEQGEWLPHLAEHINRIGHDLQARLQEEA